MNDIQVGDIVTVTYHGIGMHDSNYLFDAEVLHISEDRKVWTIGKGGATHIISVMSPLFERIVKYKHDNIHRKSPDIYEDYINKADVKEWYIHRDSILALINQLENKKKKETVDMDILAIEAKILILEKLLKEG